MAGIPSVGDILMLSQIAWKIGRAFTAGRKHAPADFYEIETEVNNLATSLKILVEVLFNTSPGVGKPSTGESLLAQADPQTKLGVATILQSCQKTLQDLDDLVQRYQDVKVYHTGAGATITDRGWSDVVLHNYATMMWTAEGGSIEELRHMLHAHTSTVFLTTQALQSRSLPQLERVVSPMASHVDDIHNTEPGQLSERVEELHQAILRLAGNSSPRLLAQRDGGESTISSIELDATGSLKSRAPSLKHFTGQPPPRHPAHSYNSSLNSNYIQALRFPSVPQRSISDRIHNPSPAPLSPTKRVSPQEVTFANQVTELPGSDPSDTASSHRRVSSADSDVLGWEQPSIRRQQINSGNQHDEGRPFSADGRPSLVLTDHDPETGDAFADRLGRESALIASSVRSTAHQWPPDSAANSMLNYDSRSISSGRRTQLAMGGNTTVQELSSMEPPIRELRALTVSGSYARSGSYDRTSSSSNTALEGDDDAASLAEKGIATRDQQHAFEQNAFRNSAILCDVRGTLVEYTRPLDLNISRLDQEITEACKACRICLVRKRAVLADGSVRLSTSIWTFSEDRKTRLQQKLVDGMEIIPYASYFTANKVSLPIPESDLVFHPPVYGGQGERTAKTSWINYVFEDAQGATHFQSLLFGRTLTHSFRTEKTLRVHEGIKGVVAYQEQLCAIELLRIWMDEIPDMHGRRGVLAMIHFSGQFRAGEGYLAFWLNSSDTPVRIKDDGGRWVKVKGLKVAVERLPSDRTTTFALVGGTAGRRDSGNTGYGDEKGSEGISRRQSDSKDKEGKGSRWVTGARIEFRDEAQKLGFLEVVRSCQQSRLTLPELAV